MKTQGSVMQSTLYASTKQKSRMGTLSGGLISQDCSLLERRHEKGSGLDSQG